MLATPVLRMSNASGAALRPVESPARVAAGSGDKPAAALPAIPRTLEESGLEFSFLVELLVKILFVRGSLRLAELVSHVGLGPGVLDPQLQFLRTQKLAEVTRRGETEGATTYALTELGRARATDFLRRSQYSGPAPVTLEAYLRQVERQSIGSMGVSRDGLYAAFSDLVVDAGLLDQFGAGMNSCGSMFIYGPAGSGKTYLAERLVRLLSGDVVVPHAIVVAGEVIQVYDVLVHRAVPMPEQGLDRGTGHDPRWVLCRRPVVMTGAELTLAMVDLELDQQTRFYQAPQQVKANNGLFILDDLGRQLVSARDLMNRWIVPLDRREDYLTLHTGQKFRVPFDVIVVFSSNLQPAELADEAFLRRLGYKIYVGPLDPRRYRAVFEKVCVESGVAYDAEGFAWLCLQHERQQRPMLACLPGDLIGQVRDYARFHGEPPQMSPALLQWAWNNYFTRQ